MNSTLNIMAMLLVATFVFHSTINYMAENIGDFENVALPPKKPRKIETHNPTLRVDATSRNSWTLIDFYSGKTYKIKDPQREKEALKNISWDLGFQRTKIITNGGETNPRGKAGVVNLGKVDFDQVSQAPENGYVQDATSWGNMLNQALSDWYVYRTRTHNVESKKNVYVVRTGGGQYVKMRIINYYCQRDEKECATVMCTRDEAACLTIEYQTQPEGTRRFPPPPASPEPGKLAGRIN